MTVKNLSVVLSFNARKAIPHNTGLINSVATAAQPAGTKRRSQVTGQVTGHRLQGIGHRLQGTGHRAQVTENAVKTVKTLH